MTRSVIFRPAAQQDLIDAEAWYEARQRGLGGEFVGRVTEAIERILYMPEMYAVAWEDVRRARLRRFPYLLYYRVVPDRIEVLAVLHGHRDPGLAQSRD